MALELWLALPTPIQPAGSSSQVSETKNQVPHSPQLSFRSYGISMGDTTAVISHLCKLHVTQEKWKGYVVEKSGISPSPQLVFIGQRLLCQVWQAKNMCVFVFSHVWLFVTPWKGIFQARVLEWVAISYPKGSSQPRDRTHISGVSCISRQILYHCATWEAYKTESSVELTPSHL